MKKIIIIGNCQAVLLKKILRAALPEDYLLFDIKPVHAMTLEDIPDLYKKIAYSDVVVCQQIHDNYNNLPLGTEQIKTHKPHDSKFIRFPNAHFEGYFPNYFYIKYSNHSNAVSCDRLHGLFPWDYHDSIVFAGFCLNIKPENLVLAYMDIKFRPEWMCTYYNDSLQLLKQREWNCDIKLKEYFECNFRNIRLFDTFNHPTEQGYNYFAKALLHKITSLDFNVDASRTGIEFGNNIFYILPSLIDELKLNVNCNTLIMHGENTSILTFIKIFYDAYSNASGVVEQNINSAKVRSSIFDLQKYFKL